MTSAKENVLKTMSFNNNYYYWNWFVNQLFGFWSFLLWKQVKWKRSYFDDKFKASFVAVDNIISQQSLKRILDYNVKYSSLFRQAVHRECFSVYEFMSNKKKCKQSSSIFYIVYDISMKSKGGLGLCWVRCHTMIKDSSDFRV
mgnify:CR=1 FL=1